MRDDEKQEKFEKRIKKFRTAWNTLEPKELESMNLPLLYRATKLLGRTYCNISAGDFAKWFDAGGNETPAASQHKKRWGQMWKGQWSHHNTTAVKTAIEAILGTIQQQAALQLSGENEVVKAADKAAVISLLNAVSDTLIEVDKPINPYGDLAAALAVVCEKCGITDEAHIVSAESVNTKVEANHPRVSSFEQW